VLSASTWTWVCLAFRETLEALKAGLQGAFWELGGLPEVLRSDNLSAATHQLKRDTLADEKDAPKGSAKRRGLTRRFSEFLDYYGIDAPRARSSKRSSFVAAEISPPRKSTWHSYKSSCTRRTMR
jgi:hypothetical protein